MAEGSNSQKTVIDKFRLVPRSEEVDSLFMEQFTQKWETFKGGSQKSRRSSRRNFESSQNSMSQNSSCPLVVASQETNKNVRNKRNSITESFGTEYSMDSGIATSSRFSQSSTNNSDYTKKNNFEKKKKLRKIDKKVRIDKNEKKDESSLELHGEKSSEEKNGEILGESIDIEIRLDEIRRKRIQWLETHKTDGSWVKCCDEICGKWRLLVEYEDPTDVPDIWFCHMNSDPDFASCSVPEEEIPLEVRKELIEIKFHVGSIVWARLDGYPWLTAIVDDCPDSLRWCQLGRSSLLPIKYHVVFLNVMKSERAWIRDRDLKAYSKFSREDVVKKIKFRKIDFTSTVDVSCELANEAMRMSVPERLQRFGWKNRMMENNRKAAKASNRKRSANLFSNFPSSTEFDKNPQILRYKIGDIVWAHADRHPWWPALIDKCSITKTHYKFPNSPRQPIEFHVVYFNEKRLIEIDWLPERSLKPFATNPKHKVLKKTKYCKKDYKLDLENACAIAKQAQELCLNERMKRFSLNARETAMLAEPPKRSKKTVLEVLSQNSEIQLSFSSKATSVVSIWDCINFNRGLTLTPNSLRNKNRSSSCVELSDCEPEIEGDHERPASKISSPTLNRYLRKNLHLKFDVKRISDLSSTLSPGSSHHESILSNEIAASSLDQLQFLLRKNHSKSSSSSKSVNERWSPMNFSSDSEGSPLLRERKLLSITEANLSIYSQDSTPSRNESDPGRDDLHIDDVSMYDTDEEKENSEDVYVLTRLFS